MIRAVAVVVPARDEEARVAACLQSVRAALVPGLEHRILLVADGCSDGTVALARAVPGVEVIEVDHANVGAARRDGVTAAIAGWRGHADELWIASTDADSVVPLQWISHQRSLADEGADVIVGTVRPDFSELPEHFRSVWLETHVPGKPNGHVHGANLGVRASAYLAAGGFSDDPEHEDTRLVERLRNSGARIVASDGGEVVTSARRVGRTPGGYAGFLRDALEHLVPVGIVTPEP